MTSTTQDTVALQVYRTFERPEGVTAVARFVLTLHCDDVGPKTIAIAIEGSEDDVRIAWQTLARRLRRLADDCVLATGPPFHSRAGGIGIYHRRQDCRHAKRIKRQNRCTGRGADPHIEGCIWAELLLDPCAVCGLEWPC